MLVASTPGVNFINILQAAFTNADPESVTIQLNCQYLFALFRSERVKAALRILMKLTPVVNIINVLLVHFLYESAFLPKCN
jgi:hypothetical protein